MCNAALLPDIAAYRLTETGPVLETSAAGKLYPDFMVSAYRGEKPDEKGVLYPQQARLVVEIATLPRGQQFPTEGQKEHLASQLEGYMAAISGNAAATWIASVKPKVRPFGMALIGTQAAFVLPELKDETIIWIWKRWRGEIAWYSIYSREWQDILDDRIRACLREVDRDAHREGRV